MVKTMKYKIVKPLDMDWKPFGDILRDLQYSSWKVLNKTIQMQWEFDNLGAEFKAKTGAYPTKDELKEWSGYKGADGYIYDVLKNEYPLLNTSNLTQTIQQGSKRWKEDKTKVFKGEKSIPSYKRTAPIVLNPGNIKKPYQTEKGYAVALSLISKAKTKEMGRKNGIIPMAILAKDNTSRVILNRITSGEYKAVGSKIIWDKKNRDWLLLLSYKFEPKGNDLIQENVMGVDLGVAVPAYMAFNNSLSRYHINGGEIEKFRRGIVSRRKAMLKQGKYCGDGRRGHGVGTRIKPTELLADKEKNFRDTANHKYSRHIVDMAIKHKCATIQMEDLSGVTENANRFMKNWTYFDLQTKIAYKAEEAGIVVVKIDPSYTSQRCSQCGHIDRGNRETQADFLCLECGYKENADYNAARNISIPGIEAMILEQLAKQGKLHHAG